jgi:WD40 repeat protein
MEQHFYSIFNSLFNERWLVPLLYVYYKQNKIISGSYDKTIRVWDLETGHKIYIFTGHTDGIMFIATE